MVDVFETVSALMGFDPEFPVRFDDQARIRNWNAQHVLNLVQCDAAISPTHWQRSRFPEILQPKIVVQHEGIDTDALGPNPLARITTSGGITLKAGDPVITYVARNLEPYRGFHFFMRALARIQQAHPNCHAVIVGGDDTSYGGRPKNAANWREKMLQELGPQLDPTRVHFLGRVPRATYLRVLQVSAAHVYLTYGRDTIIENDATTGNTDLAQFGAGINAKQLWFLRAGNDLEVSIIGTSDTFVVDDWYLGSQHHVEQFRSGDGKMLLDSQVQNLVQAMASFSPPAAGQTTLPLSYQNSLNGVIAANWH